MSAIRIRHLGLRDYEPVWSDVQTAEGIAKVADDYKLQLGRVLVSVKQSYQVYDDWSSFSKVTDANSLDKRFVQIIKSLKTKVNIAIGVTVAGLVVAAVLVIAGVSSPSDGLINTGLTVSLAAGLAMVAYRYVELMNELVIRVSAAAA